jgi:hypothetical protein
MTRKKTAKDLQHGTKAITFQVMASAEDIQRLLDAAAEGRLSRIPIEQPDGTVSHVAIEGIDITPLTPRTTDRRTWRGRESDKTRQPPTGGSRDAS